MRNAIPIVSIKAIRPYPLNRREMLSLITKYSLNYNVDTKCVMTHTIMGFYIVKLGGTWNEQSSNSPFSEQHPPDIRKELQWLH